MALNLKKNEGVDLKKINKNITKLRVGLGWDASTNGQEDFDLDASAFLLAPNGRTRSEKDLVFYGALDHVSDSVHHMGDNLVGGTGQRDDDEQITIDLTKIPSSIQEIVFTVTIYDWDVRNQNFGMIQNAYIRVLDESDPQKGAVELVRYDLTEDFSRDTAVIAAKITRAEGDSWKFVAVGESCQGGLRALCGKYGVNVL